MKADCLNLILFVRCFCRADKIIFSKIIERRAMGLYLVVLVGSLPGFGMLTMIALFQMVEK